MKKYSVMVLTGFILWLAETAYFGWNETPQSPAESILDTVSWVLIFWGIVGDIIQGIEWHKHEHIEAQSVEFTGPVTVCDKSKINIEG